MKKEPVKVALTKTRIEALPAPAKGRAYVYDTKAPGLCVSVTRAGSKTFYLYRWLNGRPQRIRIGACADLTVEQARREARKLVGEMANGVNPQDAKRAARGEATFRQAFALYIQHAKGHKKSWRQDVGTFDRYFKPLAGKKVSAIKKADVQALHARIGREHGKYAANRAVALVSIIYNGHVPGLPNPAKGVKRFKEQARDRFLDADELRRFFKALEAEPSDDWRDFFMAALLTGARKANVLAMKWDDLSLDRGLWRIPAAEAKGGEAMVCVLVPAVVRILETRAQTVNGSPWVFPSPTSASGHLEEAKKPWRGILKRAGFVDADGKNTVRIHDLRRTLGSWAAMTGSSLPIIGKALGHKNVATTQIYARLDVDPVRRGVTAATAAILDAGNGSAKAALPAPEATKEGAE